MCVTYLHNNMFTPDFFAFVVNPTTLKKKTKKKHKINEAFNVSTEENAWFSILWHYFLYL